MLEVKISFNLGGSSSLVVGLSKSETHILFSDSRYNTFIFISGLKIEVRKNKFCGTILRVSKQDLY